MKLSAQIRLESHSSHLHRDTSVRHIVPTVQDAYAAFTVGSDEKHITTVDVDGVALAAIQGLNESVEERQKALKQKEAEIESLQQRLGALERVVLGRKTAPSGGGQ